MKRLFLIISIVFTTACNSSKSDPVAVVEQATSEEKVLTKVNYTNAIHRYGEPQQTEKIALNTAPKRIQEAAATHKSIVDSTKVMHAQWTKDQQAQLNVWYIFKDNQWKPLHVEQTKQG